MAQSLAALLSGFATQATSAGASGSNNFGNFGQVPPPQYPTPVLQNMPNMSIYGYPGMQFYPPTLNPQTIMSIFAEVARLNRPVGSAHDEDTLVQALCDSERKGTTYRAALEALHAVNDHSATLWKDHYLEHRQRIDKLVCERLDSEGTSRSPGLAKKPSFEPQGCKTSGSSMQKGRPRSSSGPPPPPRIEESPGGRCKFTEEDRKFMLKYIGYRTRRKFTRERPKLAEELTKRAPHHSKASWRNHMESMKDEVEKILDEVREEYLDKGWVCSGSSDEDSDNGAAGSESSDSDIEEDDDETDEEADIKNMSTGGFKSPVNDGDRRVVARYIASVEDWGMPGSQKSRWEPFTSRYEQRSLGAWAEVYRNHRGAIDPLVKKYKRRNAGLRRKDASLQTGTPSWSQVAKRKADRSTKKRKPYDGDDGLYRGHKRSK